MRGGVVMETKIYSLIIKPDNEPIFSEQATTIGVDDEGGGIYYTIEQNDKKISFDGKEWPHIKQAVEQLIEEWGE